MRDNSPSSFNTRELVPAMRTFPALILFCVTTNPAWGQSAGWQEEMWREPQVRYLLADMTLGGSVSLYRGYAKKERDPDSREAIRLWDAGVRVVNADEFERKWLPNRYGKDGRVMRIVSRGTSRTITGNEVVLSQDGTFGEAPMRLVLLLLTLGAPPDELEAAKDPAVSEALRRWAAGCRAVNSHLFVLMKRPTSDVAFRASGHPADGARVVLNSDRPYSEANVRYFMADIALGGSIEFYRRAAERDHEMACQEAVRRVEDGYSITNISNFERKQVAGRTTITARGKSQRINGMEVKLASDNP